MTKPLAAVGEGDGDVAAAGADDQPALAGGLGIAHDVDDQRS